MTWNQYIDAVIHFVNKPVYRGICTINTLCYNISAENSLRLNRYLIAYANLKDISIESYFWPIEDRASRILFLKSLKEAE